NRINIYWKGLSYELVDNNKQKANKFIINDLNGQLSSGQLTGILGPSGAGKSTFIECLLGKRRTGLSGRVWAKHSSNKKVKLRIAYNAQNDSLVNELTVDEALRYALQLAGNAISNKRYDLFHTGAAAVQMVSHGLGSSSSDTNNNVKEEPLDRKYNINDYIDDQEVIDNNNTKRETIAMLRHSSSSSSSDDKTIDKPLASQSLSTTITPPQLSDDDLYVQQLLKAIGLVGCSHVRTGSISGGQKKRLSIALELIFSPNILLLDEPTTGLDSRSSYQCLSLLKTLSSNREPLIIGASIHQPTARLLGFFDNIYVLSVGGQCVYSGPTQTLVEHLSAFGLNCPVFHNPADYVIEMASGGHGSDPIETLVAYERQKSRALLNTHTIAKHELIVDQSSSSSHRRGNSSRNAMVNNRAQRCQRTVWRQVMDTWILTRRSALVARRSALVVWLRLVALVMVLITRKAALLEVNSTDQPDIECMSLWTAAKLVATVDRDHITLNVGLKFVIYLTNIAAGLLFAHLIGVFPTLFTLALELNTMIKEHFNNWYSFKSYYISKTLVDLPIIILFTVVYSIIEVVIIADRDWDLWYLCSVTSIFLVIANVSHSLGIFLSSLFINNVMPGLVIFSVIFAGNFMFSGCIILIRQMPVYFQWFSYLSIFRLGGEALLLQGFNIKPCPNSADYPISMEQLGCQMGVDMSIVNDCMDWADSTANMTQFGLDTFNRFHSVSTLDKIISVVKLEPHDLYINCTLLTIYSILLRN
ncbi:ATP-binding cassette sub-family G member 1-like, partial [Oppia nitens]|uniref:ATP-binding cassette sub-family G member 1-like n=1 Tax=Oppia nitens TaxID=1686743 RepID=UPI0023DAC150